jgi:hypothetical protein
MNISENQQAAFAVAFDSFAAAPRGSKRTFSRVGDSYSRIISQCSQKQPISNLRSQASWTYKSQRHQHLRQLAPSGERLASPCASPSPLSLTPSAAIYPRVTLCDCLSSNGLQPTGIPRSAKQLSYCRISEGKSKVIERLGERMELRMNSTPRYRRK